MLKPYGPKFIILSVYVYMIIDLQNYTRRNNNFNMEFTQVDCTVESACVSIINL